MPASTFCYLFSATSQSLVNSMRFPLTPVVKSCPSAWKCLGALQHTRGMAGHSHWKNVKHIKEANDMAKQGIINKLSIKIEIAVREGGGVNPKTNTKLANMIDFARSNDVPNSTIEKLLNRLANKASSGSQHFIEALGVYRTLLILDTYTDSIKKTRIEIAALLKKYGGKLGESGSSSYAYHFKGLIYVPVNPERPLTPDQATELAIEAGAEEVDEDVDDNGVKVFRFICDPKELKVVRTALEQHQMQVSDAKLGYIPHTFAFLTDAEMAVAGKLLEALSERPDVSAIYDNIQLQSST